MATGLAAGGATITATAGGVTSNGAALTVTPALAVPDVPVLNAAPAKGKGVMLTWTVPSNGGSAITGYRIYRADGIVTACPSSALTTVGAVTSYKDTATVRGQSYTYCVAAINSAGDGPPSAPAVSLAQ
jgi:hypothetical protein